MSDTISITRALSKIKTLSKEISKDCENKDFIFLARNNIKDTERYNDLKKEVKANYDSVVDKISLVIKLKYLISQSNLTSTIKINNKEMSVTEALAMKDSISLYSYLLIALRNQSYTSTNELEKNNRLIEKAITESSGQAAANSSDTDKKLFADRLKTLSEQLESSMGVHVSTGTNKTPTEMYNELETFINNFKSEIDYVLSEHNALTTIEV